MRAPRTSAAALAVVAVVTTAAAASAQPGDFGDPSTEQLADSVHVWDPDGTVRVWDPSGTVETLESETTDGDETVLTLDSDILFAFGSAEVGPTAAERIGELVADVPEAAEVSVTGHTDAIGDDASNLELSRQRAETVATAVTAARPDLVLDVDGLGESEPVAPNSNGGEDNPEGREQNRRVEVRYTS
ncbi:MAG TPA: OmpA family protein [Actinomycetales bacterium]|nr:OmpA family protein [Actinomycetales bacterium]